MRDQTSSTRTLLDKPAVAPRTRLSFVKKLIGIKPDWDRGPTSVYGPWWPFPPAGNNLEQDWSLDEFPGPKIPMIYTPWVAARSW